MIAFRLAMVQLAVGKDKAKNVQHACQMVRNAAQKGANMVVLPVRIPYEPGESLECCHSVNDPDSCYLPDTHNYLFNSVALKFASNVYQFYRISYTKYVTYLAIHTVVKTRVWNTGENSNYI